MRMEESSKERAFRKSLDHLNSPPPLHIPFSSLSPPPTASSFLLPPHLPHIFLLFLFPPFYPSVSLPSFLSSFLPFLLLFIFPLHLSLLLFPPLHLLSILSSVSDPSVCLHSKTSFPWSSGVSTWNLGDGSSHPKLWGVQVA